MENNSINKLTHRIIGCAMEVHNQYGNGFQEVVYQRCLSMEFDLQNISYVRELEMELFYKERSVGKRRVDFFIEDKIMLEIKAVEKIEKVHVAQAINYCEAYNILDGLLMNFGGLRLEYKRIYNNKLKKT